MADPLCSKHHTSALHVVSTSVSTLEVVGTATTRLPVKTHTRRARKPIGRRSLSWPSAAADNVACLFFRGVFQPLHPSRELGVGLQQDGVARAYFVEDKILTEQGRQARPHGKGSDALA
jgi:hypothetical protein